MLPAGHDGAFDETVALLVFAGCGSVALADAFSGSLVLDVADRQPQKLHCGLIIRENGPGS